MNRFFTRLLPVVALCGAALSAHAQSAPEPHHQCGGIGSDESTRMRADMKNHPLSLLFARPDGDYLANVQVRISDAKGVNVLDWKADGPICLIDLQPGHYRIEARSGEVSHQQDVTVGTTPAHADFRF